MPIGDIYLDGQPYILAEPKRLVRASANQMAAKIAVGSAGYDDQTAWSNWVQANWQAGVGQKEPTAGGFLFATAETRFEQQVLLPQAIMQLTDFLDGGEYYAFSSSDNAMRVDGETAKFYEVGSEAELGPGGLQAIAELLLTNNSREVHAVDVFLYNTGNGTNTCRIEFYDSAGGLIPGEQHTLTLTGEPGFGWYHVVPNTPISDNELTYFVVLWCDTGSVLTMGTPTGQAFEWPSGGLTLVDRAGFLARYHTTVDDVADAQSKIQEFPNGVQNTTFMAAGDDLYGLSATHNTWEQDTVGPVVNGKNYSGINITDLLATGEKLFIGLGDSTNYDTLTAAQAFSAGSVAGRLFALHNGFLWRAVGADVYYTSDESTWTGPINVADPGYSVVGMHGFGDDLIVSTENTLWRVAFGDIVRFVTDWGTIDSANGKYMHNFQGNLYISTGKSIVRYDGQSILPTGPDLGEGLPFDYFGDIVGLASNNNWLVTAIRGPVRSSVWAFNGQGWHCIGVLPKGTHASCIQYVNDGNPNSGEAAYYRSRVLVGTEEGNATYRIALPDTARSMFKLAEEETLYYYDPSGQLYTDWFYGELRDVDKDWDAVFIDGENISENSYIDIWWMDDTDPDWQFLGTIETDGQELRWEDPASRPNGKRIRLRCELVSAIAGETPVINGIRVKFMPMIRDRWRWQVNIMVAPDLQTLDGGRLTTTDVAEMQEHLDDLTNQVEPLILDDTDGRRYEVKLLDSSRNIDRIQFYNDAKIIDYIYALTLEQIVPGILGYSSEGLILEKIRLEESAAPGTPPSGFAYLYVDTNARLQLVDDAGNTYEGGVVVTGTWTPVLAGSSTPGTQTYDVQVGRYVRIGNLVMATFNITIDTKDVATAGDMLLTGLPFASANVTNNFHAGQIATWTSLATAIIAAPLHLPPNSTQMNIRKVTAAATSIGNMVAADFQNGSVLSGTMVYMMD